MKKNKLVALLAALGVLGMAQTFQASAVTPLKVTVKLTAQAQGLADVQQGTSPTFKSTIVKVKITNKEMLQLLGQAYNQDFTGATLVVDNETGDFLLLDSNGDTLADATTDGFLANFFTSESEDGIFKGQSNDNTGSSDFTDVFTNSLHYQDGANGNDFLVAGIEEFRDNFNGTSGKFTDSFTLNASGTGVLAAPPGGADPVPFFLISGTITGKGSGIDTGPLTSTSSAIGGPGR